jgi:hypothetical protein
MTRRCIRFGGTERPPSSCREVERERLFGGNGALRELNDLFCTVLLLPLLLSTPSTHNAFRLTACRSMSKGIDRFRNAQPLSDIVIDIVLFPADADRLMMVVSCHV